MPPKKVKDEEMEKNAYGGICLFCFSKKLLFLARNTPWRVKDEELGRKAYGFIA